MTTHSTTSAMSMHTQSNEAETAPQWLRLPQVIERVGMGKTWIYDRMNDAVDPFPAAIKLSRRCAVWDQRAVIAWMNRKTNGGSVPSADSGKSRQVGAEAD